MFKIVFGSILGHFIKYESRYTFVCEQFVSMVIPISDMGYSVNFYYQMLMNGIEKTYDIHLQYRYVAMVAGSLPYLIMCMHSFTRSRGKRYFMGSLEMWNFLKNLTVMQLGIVARLAKHYEPLRYVWVGLAIVCIIITFWWDVR